MLKSVVKGKQMGDEKFQQMTDGVLDIAGDLEDALTLKKGFFFQLLHSEDDWSFLIKLHALLESALSHVLTEHFGDPRLSDSFAGLQMWQKIEFARSVDIIDGEDRLTLKAIGELRNSVVHKVANVDFRFAEMTEAKIEQHRARFHLDEKWSGDAFRGAFRAYLWAKASIVVARLSTSTKESASMRSVLTERVDRLLEELPPG